MDTVDDLLYELRGTGFSLHNLYERDKSRGDGLIGNELLGLWACRIVREMPDQSRVYAHGAGDTPAAAIRAALTDTQRALADHVRPVVKATLHTSTRRGATRETVNVTLSDLGL